jgi:hypothetical protein
MVIVHRLLEAGAQNVVVCSPPAVNDAAADSAKVRSVAASLGCVLVEWFGICMLCIAIFTAAS